jgi:hypothetical protein
MAVDPGIKNVPAALITFVLQVWILKHPRKILKPWYLGDHTGTANDISIFLEKPRSFSVILATAAALLHVTLYLRLVRALWYMPLKCQL